MMNNNSELNKFKNLEFMQSRIPALDSLSTFIPEGEKPNGIVQDELDKTGFARFYPTEGGHKVIVPYEGGEYNTEYFTIEKKAWDHEHCKVCGEHIPPMTLCSVTKSGPYIVLCESCYKTMEEM